MDTVKAVLEEHITDQNVRFVFPSQTSANLWAQKTCTLGISRSVAVSRFLAWDRFKEEAIQENITGLSPSNMVMRKLFSEALIQKNAGASESGGCFLKAVIPPEHAQGGRIFAPYIAGILPSLASWEKLVKNASSNKASQGEPDPTDGDFHYIKTEYSEFMKRFNLFEPSWEEVKILEDGTRYVIFFPELIEDFSEYDALLPLPRFVRISTDTVPFDGKLVLFKSVREEIRSAVMEIRKLHEEGIPYEEMAVSVPELEEMEPCLLREFTLHHVPVIRRAGKKLGEAGIGRFFILVSECASGSFAFNSVKALLLSDHVPWKDRKSNKAIVRFGINYNCVSSYIHDGKTVDIWEEAFREALNEGLQGEGRVLQSYYRDLKKHILALTGAKNFIDIRNHYFAFRNKFLDMDYISEDDDAVLSRCIDELSSLIELEERINDPALTPVSPYSFYLGCIGDKEYVRAGQKPGVNIFRWRVAAASPFRVHFVLNASQNAASVLYQPMRFLRQDRRRALGLEDVDASGAFFRLCPGGSSGSTRISSSTQTFSGWTIPHSFFVQGKIAESPLCPPCPYAEERRFWKEFSLGTSSVKMPHMELLKIYPLQKHSYNQWKKTLSLKENNFSLFKSPYRISDSAGKLLQKAIMDKDGHFSISPTNDLNVYHGCSAKWLFRKVFGVEEFSLEAELLDDISLGLLYHRILQGLFGRIKNEDKTFNSLNLDIYKTWALEITKAAIEEEPAFKGPLAIPLVLPQAEGMAKKLGSLLELEAKYFDSFEIAELEYPVRVASGDFTVKGIIDRISISPEGNLFIFDYKTSWLQEQTAMEDLDEVSLSEFQMPIYIKLCEKFCNETWDPDSELKVNGAYFYSIKRKKLKAAMGEIGPRTRSKVPDREEYEMFLEAAENQIEEFSKKVKTLDFCPSHIRFGDCIKCDYKTACRTVYSAVQHVSRENIDACK